MASQDKLKKAKTDMDKTIIEEEVFNKYYARYKHPYDSLMWLLSGSCGYCGAIRYPGQKPKDIPPKRTIEGGWRE